MEHARAARADDLRKNRPDRPSTEQPVFVMIL
jgi:hypothetical protein